MQLVTWQLLCPVLDHVVIINTAWLGRLGQELRIELHRCQESCISVIKSVMARPLSYRRNRSLLYWGQLLGLPQVESLSHVLQWSLSSFKRRSQVDIFRDDASIE